MLDIHDASSIGLTPYERAAGDEELAKLYAAAEAEKKNQQQGGNGPKDPDKASDPVAAK